MFPLSGVPSRSISYGSLLALVIENKRVRRLDQPAGKLGRVFGHGRELRIHDFASDAELAEIFTARAQLGGEPVLRDLFDHLREKYDYFQLRMAALYHKRLRGQ